MNKKITILLSSALVVSAAALSAAVAAGMNTKDESFKGVEISLGIGENKAFLRNDANEKDITLDVKPFIKNNRTYTPARFVAEALGAKVEWDGNTKQVTIDNDITTIVLTIGSKTALVNGKSVTIDAPAMIKYDRTFTPVRFVAETLGADVTYDAASRTVNIVKEGSIISRITPMGTPVPEEDAYMDQNAVDYSKYIGSYGIPGETYVTLTITDINADGGTFYFDTVNFHRMMFRGPFKATFNENGILTGKGYNSYGGVNETFSLTFSGDKIEAKSGSSSWAFNINSNRIPMIDVTLDH